MRKQTSSLDGFVPRRRPNNMGEIATAENERGTTITARPEINANEEPIDMKRRDIDESLAGIDNEEPPKKRRGLFRRRRQRKVLTRKQKIIRRLIKFLLLVIVLVIAFVAIKTFIATNNVLQGNIFDILQNRPLKTDKNGRSNVLLFGTSEDDNGHDAPYLTDSIMVISIDQKQKNAYMVSIPRDFHVKYGTACASGYEGKINVLYQCFSGDGKYDEKGSKALSAKVGEVLGLDIQYYAHVNYGVVRDTVNAVGGVDVNIQSDPISEGGVLDRNFDWKCNYRCYYVKYKNGVHHLDGEHALALSRARGDVAPTYGFARSNFDREINQQKIIKALQKKALSTGTLTNVGKVTGLIDALGNNLRTNFQTAEVRTLMQLGQDIPSDSIKSLSLIEDGNELVASASWSSDIIPVAGTYDYSQIQAYIAKKLSNDPVVREAASVYVFNGTNEMGLAQTEATKLKTANYVVAATDNAPTSYTKTVVYRFNKKSDVDGTAKALAKRYGVKLKSGAAPFAISGNPDFVIILGANAAAAKTNTP